MNSVLDDDIDDDHDNDGGVDSCGTDESSEECDEDLVQQCSKKRKYSVKPHLPSEKPHPSSEKPHPPSEKPHTPSRKPHTSSEKPCHPMSEKPHHSSEKPPSQKSNTDKAKKKEMQRSNTSFLKVLDQQSKDEDSAAHCQKHLSTIDYSSNSSRTSASSEGEGRPSTKFELFMMEQIPQINRSLKKLIQAVTIHYNSEPNARMAKSPEKLALNLLGVFFTQDQLTKGNCTPTPDHKDLLDPRIINGIRLHLKYKYPMDDKDQEQMRWKAVLSKLNAKCQSFRRPPHRGRRAGSAVSSEGAGSVSVNNPAATPDHTSLEAADFERPSHC
eukprot:Em0007g1036a